ncbi:putative uncharacterized protein DDB_G0282133 [Stomoxys calcitrans]|uniref:putative uncharacterized protein DDB_G0282133 n=1 Tax=Stomoxys calcitrans TaxID=35570 RepID=UPI0027E38FB8|nr:putative uncharacterized protein DDB_G0282133 [Stomoxys calcitrans]
MFPQSELDNYKLQVELLQEKLQRSEISRQQLEHKLDKILQKREEHDKMVRSRSKQRYQQFLEEQHRRNERNKQLVQMLERVEQQTAAMNARSERLKMMKLQYEMYFAKLVHSQTRRCLQSSSVPILAPRMATTPLPGATAQTRMMSTPAVDAYTYSKIYEEPVFIENNYQRYGNDPLIMERDFLNRSQRDVMPESKLMEMPLSEYTLSSARSDGLDMRKDPNRPYNMQPYEPSLSARDGDEHQNLNAPEQKLYTNISETKRYEPAGIGRSDTGKKCSEFDLPTSLSSTSDPLTFESIPNANIGQGTISTDTSASSRGNDIEPRNSGSQDITQLKQQPDLNENNSILSSTKPDLNMQQSSQNVTMEITNQDSIKSPKNQHGDKQPFNQQDIIKEQSELHPLPETSAEKSQAPSVSIENIESAIYGELVNSPEAKQNLQQPEKATASPALLDNLVTQSPTKTETNEQGKENPPETVADKDVINYDTTTVPTKEDTKTTDLDNQNYPQSSYDYNQSNTSTENVANNSTDYSGYESNPNATEEAMQGQEQQQYDYSNYDPSQYSYPGYIYDEATGEYKPDPNATSDQYGTDQQYTEGYQYQQQEGYDYNQTYDQQDPQLNTTDPAAYENFNATQSEQDEITSEATTPKSEIVSEQKPAETSNVESTDGNKTKPTSILATADKKEAQKNKKRVNFVESSETDESSVDKGQTASAKPNVGNESDFDFSSSSDTGTPKQS